MFIVFNTGDNNVLGFVWILQPFVHKCLIFFHCIWEVTGIIFQKGIYFFIFRPQMIHMCVHIYWFIWYNFIRMSSCHIFPPCFVYFSLLCFPTVSSSFLLMLNPILFCSHCIKVQCLWSFLIVCLSLLWVSLFIILKMKMQDSE